MKRALCLVLAFCIFLCTGCNSLLSSGNFEITTYETASLAGVTAGISDDLSNQIASSQEADDASRYSLDGYNAFYFLPDHENSPSKITDFQVLDYADGVGFIYCYKTDYYGSAYDSLSGSGGSDTLLQGLSLGTASGTVAESERLSQTALASEGLTATYQVVVLMSYNPYTGAYQVFFSALEEKDNTTTTVVLDDMATLSADISESGVMAQCVGVNGTNRYFLFFNETGYLFNAAGTLTWIYDYSTLLEQEIASIKKANAKSGYELEVTITDVVMDGEGYVYIPLSVTFNATSQETATDIGSIDDDDDFDESDLSDDDFMELNEVNYVISCFNIDIGRDNVSDIHFISESYTAEAQLEKWLEIDGYTLDSLEEAQALLEAYSMDNIKSGTLDSALADSFSLFYSRDNAINLTILGLEDLYASGLNIYSDLITMTSYELTMDIFAATREMNAKMGRSYISAYSSAVSRIISADPQSIYSLMPGLWDATEQLNVLPALDADGKISVYLAKKITKYTGGGTSSRILSIDYPNRFSMTDNTFAEATPVIEVYETIDGREVGEETSYTRTLTYLVETEYTTAHTGKLYYGSDTDDDTLKNAIRSITGITDSSTLKSMLSELKKNKGSDSDGNYYVLNYTTSYTETSEETLMETLKATPISYEMLFPSGTQLYFTETTKTDSIPISSATFGVIYFADTSDSTASQSEALSTVEYVSGTNTLLYDTQVTGKAMDAVLLSCESATGVAYCMCLITGAGITFYQGGGSATGSIVFDASSKTYVALEDIGTSVGLAIDTAVSNLYTGTTEGVSDSQQATIDAKLESGSATQIFNASNFVMLNQEEVIISSLYSGLVLCNLNSGLNVSLQSGCYFAAFAKGDTYMVVGYNTDDYAYQSYDIAWAKCYEWDLESRSAQMELEAMENYLDSLADAYVSRQHNVTETQFYTLEGLQVIPLTGIHVDDSDTDADELAYVLFYGTESTAITRLNALVKEILGLSDAESLATLKAHLLSLREKLSQQRKALTELYQIVGLGVMGNYLIDYATYYSTQKSQGYSAYDLIYDTDYAYVYLTTGYTKEVIDVESSMLRTTNTQVLEEYLLSLALSDTAMALKSGAEKELYEVYLAQKDSLDGSGTSTTARDAYAAYLAQKDGLAQSTTDDSTTYSAESVGEEEIASILENIENASYTTYVLADIKERFASLQQDVTSYAAQYEDWDSYLSAMLKIIAPDYAVDTKQDALDLFAQVTNLTVTDTIQNKLSGIYRISDLEEMIIQYTIEEGIKGSTLSVYALYEEAWNSFLSNSYTSKTLRAQALSESLCYEIILDLQAQNAAYLQEKDMTWEELLRSLILECGGGIVLTN